jgi:hypothetical protein
MERTRGMKALTIFAVLTLFAATTAAQQPHSANGGRVTEGRTYQPRIKYRTHSAVIEGRITKLEEGALTIKTARGEMRSFRLDERTSVFESGELVSIATMADIVLSASDLSSFDYVEIVTERIGRRDFARIITRLPVSSAEVAKR